MTVRLGTKLIANTGSGGTGGGTNVLVDNITITKDDTDVITTVAIDNKNNNSDIPAVKTWMGTLAEYEAIENKSNDIIYYITDDETLAQSANISLSNLSETGQSKFDEKANVADVLNKSQITNCLLEVPQRIKVELNSNVPTLLAGSQVIIDNDYYTIPSDTISKLGTTTGQRLVFYEKERNAILAYDSSRCGSGDTLPTDSSVYGMFYLTTDHKVYRYLSASGGWTSTAGYSLPIMLATGNGVVDQLASIDQVFNGFGYIGSTIWSGKGIKIIIPNGRNTDGSLNNIEYETTEIGVRSVGLENTFCSYVLFNNSNIVDYRQLVVSETRPTTLHTAWYKPSENILYTTYDGNLLRLYGVVVLDCFRTSTAITNFQPKEPLSVADYNDLQTKVSKNGDTMTGELRFDNNGTGAWNGLIIKSSNIDYTAQYTAHQCGGRFLVTDKNNQWYSYLQSGANTNKFYLDMCTRRSVDGELKTATMGVSLTNAGTGYAYCPNPLAVSDTNHIATTSWVRQHRFIPSTKYVELSIGASDTRYTAPADGYYYAGGVGTGNGYIYMQNTTNGFATESTGISSIGLNLFIPVKKGDIVLLGYFAVTMQKFRFYYALGDT